MFIAVGSSRAQTSCGTDPHGTLETLNFGPSLIIRPEEAPRRDDNFGLQCELLNGRLAKANFALFTSTRVYTVKDLLFCLPTACVIEHYVNLLAELHKSITAHFNSNQLNFDYLDVALASPCDAIDTDETFSEINDGEFSHIPGSSERPAGFASVCEEVNGRTVKASYSYVNDVEEESVVDFKYCLPLNCSNAEFTTYMVSMGYTKVSVATDDMENKSPSLLSSGWMAILSLGLLLISH